MRETLGRNFDVIVVVWALALATAWMLFFLARADVTNADWTVPGAMAFVLL